MPRLILAILLLHGVVMTQTSSPALAIERYVLPNGLTVILHEDHALPIAAVNIWYRVGSKDEVAGRSGFAHLFEHLMFMGTERVPQGRFDEIMEAGGGSNNATTSQDRTNYFESGPAEMLPTLLWLEADRMEDLGRCITQEKLDLQRDVVKNERRQSYENRPYARAWLELPAMMYPEGHPYAHSVIGSHKDLEAASVEDVRDFFATHYVPANAALVVAGDFEPAATKELIAKLFGTLPVGRKPAAAPIPVPVHLDRIIRRSMEDKVPAARVSMSFHSPRHFAAGDAEADLVASLLGEGAASRLERVLVQERRLAQSVSASQQSGLLSSMFMVSAVAMPGVSAAELEAAMDAVLKDVLKDGFNAADVERAVSRAEAGYAAQMQELLTRADLLNQYEMAFGNPDGFERDLARYRSATAASVNATLRNIITPGQRAVMTVLPEGTTQESVRTPRDARPCDLATKNFTPAVPQCFKIGGMEVWLLERRQAPLVSLALSLPLGSGDDAPTRAGLTALTTALMHEGVRGNDAADFAMALERLGGGVTVKAGKRQSVAQMLALSRNFDATFDLLADLLLRPTLGEPDFERVKAQQLAGIEQRAKDPGTIATLVAARRLAEERGRRADPASGYLTTVNELTHGMVRERHAALLAALGGARIVVCGDITREALESALKRQFGALPALAVPAREKAPAPFASRKLYIVDRPDAPQTVIRFQHDAPALGSAFDAPLQLANTIFGGSFTSRLSQNLREKNGFTYGAGSRVSQDADEGAFVATSNVRTEVTGPAIREFLAEFQRLAQRDFTVEELAKAKAAERTDLVRTFEEVSATSGALLLPLVAGRGPGHLGEYAALAAATALEAVNVAAEIHMQGFPGVLVLVGDAKSILPQLVGIDLPTPEWCDSDGNLIKR